MRSASSRSARNFFFFCFRNAVASSAIRLRSSSASIFLRFGGTGYLLPNEQFLFGCINRRFAFFLGSNLFGNGVATFRFGFLQLLQGFFLVGNHSIGYGLCHIPHHPQSAPTMASQAVSLSACSYSGFPAHPLLFSAWQEYFEGHCYHFREYFPHHCCSLFSTGRSNATPLCSTTYCQVHHG